MKTKREIRFLKYLSHPNIIKLYEVLDNNSYIFVVMELATKG
jgi:serine/threonine protein kinase